MPIDSECPCHASVAAVGIRGIAFARTGTASGLPDVFERTVVRIDDDRTGGSEHGVDARATRLIARWRARVVGAASQYGQGFAPGAVGEELDFDLPEAVRADHPDPARDAGLV